MGSGKTSVGKKLSSLVDYQFVDTDQWIEKREQKSISEIFELEGENRFRSIEHECFLEIVNMKNTVVSTGGGLPCHFNHIDLMNQHGISIYLEADASFLASRLLHHKNKRPLIADVEDEDLPQFLGEILMERAAFYEKSKIHIDSKNLKASDIVDAIKLHGLSF